MYLNNKLYKVTNIRSLHSKSLSASWVELEWWQCCYKGWWYSRIHLVSELSGKLAFCSPKFCKNLWNKSNTVMLFIKLLEAPMDNMNKSCVLIGYPRQAWWAHLACSRLPILLQHKKNFAWNRLTKFTVFGKCWQWSQK